MPMMVMSDGCALHYRWDGDAAHPVLLFSTSLGYTLEMWDPQIEDLSRRYRILRYDHRGHGASQAPIGPYTIERMTLDVEELMAGFDLVAVNYCGLSIGGMIGIRLCAHSPQLIRRAVLANTSAHLDAREKLTQRLALIERHGMGAVANEILERSLSTEFRQREPGHARQVREMITGMSPEAYIAGGQAVLGMDERGDLPAITLPVLVINGALDTATPPAMGEKVAAGISGSTLVTLQAAHLSNIEQPAAFNGLLLDFFAEQEIA